MPVDQVKFWTTALKTNLGICVLKESCILEQNLKLNATWERGIPILMLCFPRYLSLLRGFRTLSWVSLQCKCWSKGGVSRWAVTLNPAPPSRACLSSLTARHGSCSAVGGDGREGKGASGPRGTAVPGCVS